MNYTSDELMSWQSDYSDWRSEPSPWASRSWGEFRPAITLVPINLAYFFFSAVMVYLTAYRNTTLCGLHVVITATFLFTFLARLDQISELLPSIFHILVGLMAFYHAVASLTTAFTGHALFPLGPALLHHRAGRAHS